MKRSLLIALLLLAWAPPAALADYDARKSEAMSQVDKAEITDEERRELKEALDRYFDAREDCLEALVGIVAKEDKGEQDAMFVARAYMCASGGAQILGDGLDDIEEPTIGALGFLNVFASHEAAFYQSLAATTVAEARDKIVVIRINLADLTEALDKKWRTIREEDEPLDERAKSMAAEIRADLDAVIEQAAESHRDAAELIAEGVKQWAQAATSPTFTTGYDIIDQTLGLAKGALGPTIQLWQNTNTRAQSRASSYRALFASETRVLVMFRDVRAEVKEFLEENDFPRAEAEYSQAKSSLDSFVSSAKTSGQSSDASELRDDLMANLAGHLKDGADVYSKFVSANKGRFVGALGPDIEEELVEQNVWEQYARYLDGYRLDSKLREWHLHGTNYFDVDLRDLSSGARDRLKDGLRGTIEELLKGLKVAEEAYRAIDSLIAEEREDVASPLD